LELKYQPEALADLPEEEGQHLFEHVEGTESHQG
jgi:hypothetical protein